jgi:hypothetical protein
MGISSDAVTGFVGVVTGSAITGGFQLYLTRRNERRDHRAALRRVLNELLNAQAMVKFGRDNPDQWKRLVAHIETDAWERYADALARDPKLRFGTLSGAYRGIAGVQAIVAEGPPSEPFLTDAIEALDRAVELLQRRASRPWPPWSRPAAVPPSPE